MNFVKNYSQWNLVVLHPNLRSVTRVFSFNYQPLQVYGNFSDIGMFWGIEYYNDMLLTHGNNGNVQTELLLQKDRREFTFREGWTFPRTISFNGDQCVMPSPDAYPSLPNTAHTSTLPTFFFSLKREGKKKDRAVVVAAYKALKRKLKPSFSCALRSRLLLLFR
ncbi:unnamed protein product [Sphenostylis stenocarpa]|uniref:COBRA C-terminal domain-containing protein n=1 Tax=Sphenostylis stenocarpa TaxID=92480 RepID=A0AA86TEU4_9FABA|nr:unnamed protein product [Sphenostylis stenocarpa]